MVEYITARMLFLVVALIAILLILTGHFLATRILHPSYQYLKEVPSEYVILFSLSCGISTLVLQHFTRLGEYRSLCAIGGLIIGSVICYVLFKIFSENKNNQA